MMIVLRFFLLLLLVLEIVSAYISGNVFQNLNKQSQQARKNNIHQGWISSLPALSFSNNIHSKHNKQALLMSSYSMDGSEYSSKDSDYDEDDDMMGDDGFKRYRSDEEEEEADNPTVELQPVPMSKNSGNRFVAFVWDRHLNTDKDRDVLDLHEDRIALTEDHVMFCRKANLYNDDFNTDSMVDVLWSRQVYVLLCCCFLDLHTSLCCDLLLAVGTNISTNHNIFYFAVYHPI